VVTTLAGSGSASFADGTGAEASFKFPGGLAADKRGNIYVADSVNNRIRKITSTGVVTTLAGSNESGFADGRGAAASFNRPQGLTIDTEGNVFVADSQNYRIRKITPAGVVTTFAGGEFGTAEGLGTMAKFKNANDVTAVGKYLYISDGGMIRRANLVAQGSGPQVVTQTINNTTSFYTGISIDSNGNLFVIDDDKNGILKITPEGAITPFAGGGTKGFVNGTGAAAKFDMPAYIIIDTNDNLYVSDSGNNAIRKITPAGLVTTVAGSGATGSDDGVGDQASFSMPIGLMLDLSGNNLYVADSQGNSIRKINLATSDVTTFAGGGDADWVDDTGTNAKFNAPRALTQDSVKNIYVADSLNHRIRKITPEGVVTTLAGHGADSFTDGVGTAASFQLPADIKADSLDNLYVSDTRNHRIRKINLATSAVTTFAGSGSQGSKDGAVATATFNSNGAITFDIDGNLYVCDQSMNDGNNAAIRKIKMTGIDA
jgi:sugar lactone lactonase YvrE